MRTMVFVLDLKPHHVEAVQKAAPGWKIVYGKNREVWADELLAAEIVGGWNRYVKESFLQNPGWQLKWLQNWGAGVDVLPLADFAGRGVLITNASGVHANPISETVLAMMLGLTRKIHTYVRNQAKHVWNHSGLMPEMHGKAVGVLGIGAIGEEVARLCKAFGMHVLGVRRSIAPSAVVDEMFGMSELQSVLARCDYVVNTLPLTDETRHLIGQAEFQAMKPSAFYINIGRGATTDEQALATALQQGTIAGAGLDVFEVEPMSEDSPLWDMENVIVTPHTSGSTPYYDDRVIEIFIENLESYIKGEGLVRNVVDLSRQY